MNVGVAAHITAASQGGPRYDADLTPDERKSADNGIWLCQTCAKLIDSDDARYTVTKLRKWKDEAEEKARQELESRSAVDESTNAKFARIRALAPKLIEEMKQDLGREPLSREFVLLRRGWVYLGTGQELVYYYDDHPDLGNLVRILENSGLIREITTGSVRKFVISEALAAELTQDRH